VKISRHRIILLLKRMAIIGTVTKNRKLKIVAEMDF